MHPAKGVRRGYANFLWNNDKNRHCRDVLERINLIATVHPQRPPSKEKKRYIRPKRSGDSEHLRTRELLLRQLQVAEHRGSRIARASAKPTARRNPLSQLDFHTAMAFELAPDRIHRAVRQVLLDGFGGEGRVSQDRQPNSWSRRSAKPEFIVQRDGLKNRAQLVISIGALPQNIQAQIDFRERWDANLGHS